MLIGVAGRRYSFIFVEASANRHPGAPSFRSRYCVSPLLAESSGSDSVNTDPSVPPAYTALYPAMDLSPNMCTCTSHQPQTLDLSSTPHVLLASDSPQFAWVTSIRVAQRRRAEPRTFRPSRSLSGLGRRTKLPCFCLQPKL